MLPFEWHFSHGVDINLPVPEHLSQVFTVANVPIIVFWVACTFPLPWHLSHVVTFVPGFAPLPWHTSQLSFLEIDISFCVPKAASSKDIVMLYLKSAPFVGPCLLDDPPKPENPPPNTLPNISSISISTPIPFPNPEKSNPENPPAPPKPACSKLEPNLSYWARFCESDKTLYASDISLNLASAFFLSSSLCCASGWYCFASFLYAFFISSSVALFDTPSNS